MVYQGHTAKAAALTQLILASFPFHGALQAAGERLTAPVGLTAARWQVLSAAARSDRPEPVANIARIMGLARQSVQRSADELTRAGLIAFGPNPHHKRAALIHLTEKGRKAFEAITKLQVPWANALAKDLDADDIAVALRLIDVLRRKLEARMGEGYAPSEEGVSPRRIPGTRRAPRSRGR
jgi:DNA-binding MarR family transcriptional regulator